MPLHIALATGSMDAMRMLLELKADPNAEDDVKERLRSK